MCERSEGLRNIPEIGRTFWNKCLNVDLGSITPMLSEGIQRMVFLKEMFIHVGSATSELRLSLYCVYNVVGVSTLDEHKEALCNEVGKI